MSESIVQFRDVSHSFASKGRNVVACQKINLSVRKGEFLALVGPSGCGKSTLMNMAAGLMKPSLGSVCYDGKEIDGPNTAVGYLTQRDTLLPWRTIEDNVAISLELRGEARELRREKARVWLERTGLTGFERAYPSQLSGGMRRRACIARTLVYEPETLMMDEPFGALDAQLRLVMHDELLRLWSASDMTIIFVTHDLAEAVALADRVVVFSSRPGRVVTIEDITLPRPRDVFRIRFDAEFVKLHDKLWSYLEAGVRKASVS